MVASIAATARRVRPASRTSASASQSGTGARRRSLRHGPHAGEPAEPLHGSGQRDLFRRVGGPDPLERLGVGLAVGAHAVDPHLVHGHRRRRARRCRRRGRRRRARRAPGTRCARRAAARRRRARCSSSRRRPSSSAAATGPARRRSSSAGSVERDRGHVSRAGRGRRRRPRRRARARDPSSSAAATEHQRQVAEVGAAAGPARCSGRRPTTAASGSPWRSTTTSVPCAASATSRATPRRLASVTLTRSVSATTTTVQKSAQTSGETLTCRAGCRILPPARRPLRVCPFLLLHGNKSGHRLFNSRVCPAVPSLSSSFGPRAPQPDHSSLFPSL